MDHRMEGLTHLLVMGSCRTQLLHREQELQIPVPSVGGVGGLTGQLREARLSRN